MLVRVMDELPEALSRIVSRSSDPARARELVLESLTHRTWLNEHPGAAREDNQRLEYLGDAVLELVVTHALFDRLPTADEGLLSRARASAVNEGALATAARAIDLGVHLRLGRGESASGGRERARTLADALEAVVAAAYLLNGLEGARAFVEDVLGDAISAAIRAAEGAARGTTGVDARAKDPKSVLQEIVQRGGGPPPVYVHEEPTGPIHDRTFHARVMAAGRELGRGDGHSRREAEMKAASAAILTLESSHASS
jgi:ribonuclease-3